jgi:hypothetical protein
MLEPIADVLEEKARLGNDQLVGPARFGCSVSIPSRGEAIALPGPGKNVRCVRNGPDAICASVARSAAADVERFARIRQVEVQVDAACDLGVAFLAGPSTEGCRSPPDSS